MFVAGAKRAAAYLHPSLPAADDGAVRAAYSAIAPVLQHVRSAADKVLVLGIAVAWGMAVTEAMRG
jgi:class 3 adenylate cyclase